SPLWWRFCSGDAAGGLHTWSLCTQTATLPVGIILFLPLLGYALWDALIWLSARHKSTESSIDMHDVAWRWLVLDAVGLFIVLAFVASALWLRGDGRQMKREIVVECFLVVVTVVIGGDYLLNHRFYFPSSRRYAWRRHAR